MQNLISNIADILESMRQAFTGEAIPSDLDFLMQCLTGDFDVNFISKGVQIAFTPSLAAKRSYLYLQGITETLYSPSHMTSRSGLESYLLAITFAGNGRLVYGGKEYEIGVGDGFLIDCRRPHEYQATSEEGWGYWVIHFNGFAMPDLFEQIEAADCVRFPAAGDTITRLRRKLIEANVVRQFNSELLCNCILTEILTEILTVSAEFQKMIMPPKIREICAYISRHHAENLTLDSIAEQFFISKFHLVREFKRFSGTTPNEYLIGARLARVKELLVQTSMTIEDIRQAVGINSSTHLIYLFKNRTGMTPSQFRESLKNIQA